jgi:MarR family 2-MHQ and catechol resistance regulon transcriptional repressor
MPGADFANLLEYTMVAFARLGSRVKVRTPSIEYPRQMLKILTHLYFLGRIRLKDFANHHAIPVPNVCAAFRSLEKDGLVKRERDESDRRNTWYSATPAGAELAKRMLAEFRDHVRELFAGLSRADEARLKDALKTINEIVNNLE